MKDETIKEAVCLFLKTVAVLEKGETLIVDRDTLGNWQMSITDGRQSYFTGGTTFLVEDAYDGLLKDIQGQADQ